MLLLSHLLHLLLAIWIDNLLDPHISLDHVIDFFTLSQVDLTPLLLLLGHQIWLKH